MPEIKITSQNYDAAQAWAAENAKRLRLRFQGHGTAIKLHKKTARRSVFLQFEFWAAERDWRLRAIEFYTREEYHTFHIQRQQSVRYAIWHVDNHPQGTAPPASLEQLIESEDLKSQADLKKAAERFPAFYEAYDEVYKRLFPPFERSGLHTGPEEYVECIAADNALMRRLKKP